MTSFGMIDRSAVFWVIIIRAGSSFIETLGIPDSTAFSYLICFCSAACEDEHEVWDITTRCEQNCVDRENDVIPKNDCHEHCKCKDGYYRDEDEKCVKGKTCDQCVIDGVVKEVCNHSYTGDVNKTH
jgi:hypothetical protein